MKLIHLLVFFLLLLPTLNVTVQGDNLGGIVVHQSVTEYETDKPLNYFEDNITIVTSNAAKYQNGLNIFPYNTGAQNNFLSIMTMDGKIIRTPLEDVANPSMLNDTTIFAALQGNPLFWNFITGDTEWFNLTENQHHDMSYNPTTDTFMMLERETVAVVNNTGQIENMSIDTIFEYDRDGNVKWEWHLDDHTNYSWYYEDLERINQSKVDFSRGRLDPTHANSIYWDTEEDKVYLNVRHFHQVYKIDRQTGAVDW
ncbi:MAG: aryl-sulfate sulfotransferase, partial [Candidatus Kariarchaeaceae archaeon]